MFGRKNEKIVLTKTPSTVFVAVAFNGGGYMPYFEQCEYFAFHSVIEHKQRRKNMLSISDHQTEAAIDTLVKMKTDVVIARGFGPKALYELKAHHIICYAFEGGAHAAFKAYLDGSIKAYRV